MTKPKTTLCLIVLSALLAVGSTAQAKSWTINDSYYAWPGYPSGTGWGIVDEYGSPNIASMTINLDATNTHLTSVVLNLTSDNIIRWDSLFINTSYVSLPTPTDGVSGVSTWDQHWDYFVHTGGSTLDVVPGATINGSVQTVDGLYSVAQFLGNTVPDKYYTTVGPSGRDGHPDGIDKGSLGSLINGSIVGVHDPNFSSKINDVNITGQITYTFSSLNGGGIAIGNGVTVGYSPWCANDVFLASAPVPEPATMLLFGAGLAGLAGFSRNRKKKK